MKKAIITEKDICELLTGYDNNNANQVYTSGGLEYSLFEMVSKKFMRTQYSPEWKEAIDGGYTYCHDAAQELFKGINCFTLDPREVIRKGLRTYGDNNIGVTSSPPKHFDTALELIEQTMGLAVVYCAGGIACASINTFLAPFMVGESDKNIKQAIQSLLFQMNQSFKNRGCVAGDTDIWVKLDGNIQLMTFKEISDLLNADYGSTDLTGINLEILTLTDNREVKWVKPTLFWHNKPRDLYEVVLPKGRSFKCDKNHGLISANNINVVRNILDIKKGTQLCDSKGINFFTDIEQDTDYWNGVLYGFWLGDGYKNYKGNNTAITVGKKDKIEFLDLLFDKIDVDVNRTVTRKKTDEKHKIPEYVNYYFPHYYLVSEDDNMENKNYLAGLITGMLNSDGNVRISNRGILDVSFQNSNEWYVDLLRYALFYFGIRCNKNVKSRKNPKPNWSSIYRLNMEYNKNAEYLYRQLELRPLFKEAVNKSLPVNFYGTTNRMLVKSITPLNEQAETYCFTANGRMIIDSGFILTNNSQSMFSSLNMDLEMPEWLKNEAAYGPGGVVCGVYGDYQDEAKRFVHLLTEVSIEGDAEDKPLFMPNLIYNIDGADLNEWLDVFELSAKFSSPYFCHYKANNVEYQSTLGCRSALPANWTGDPNIDCMGLGNSVYTTISLPAIALKTVEEGGDFYKILDYYMELVREYNKNRLEWIYKLWYEYHTADFMIQKMPSGRPLYDLDNATIVCGYLGLSEALEILGYGDITVANDKAREIMTYMGDKIAGWKNEDNLRFGLFQTPAENLAYKNAQKMVKKYGFKRSHAKGTATRPYYTNSNHVPVDSNVGLVDKIRIEGNNQPIGAAGNIMNVYLGESYSEASALKSLCEKIRDNTDAYFWAFTGDYAICPECNSKFKGNIEECPFDGAETDVYSRVTGYLTNTKTWNAGKREELIRRYRY